jgi:hypothetical protein
LLADVKAEESAAEVVIVLDIQPTPIEFAGVAYKMG